MNQRNVIKQLLKERQGSGINHRMQTYLDRYEYKRAVVIQALMIMIATFAQGGICTLLLLLFQFDQRSIDVILVFKSILYPMQGFWNLIIIVYDKAYLVLHRNDRSIAIWKIIKDILFYPPQAHEIDLPSGFRNATVTDGANMVEQSQDENVEEEIEVTNIILRRRMDARSKERFDDTCIDYSIQGLQNVDSVRNDDDLDEFLPTDSDFEEGK